MRRTAIATLAGLTLAACAAGKPNPAPAVPCFHWAFLLKDGLVRRGLDRAAVERATRHFELPLHSSGKALCGSGPAGPQWECLVEDYPCSRGDLPPATVRVIYRSKEGTPSGPAGLDDVAGRVWIVESCGFEGAEAPPLPGNPAR
jgi:hypothetical protein